MVKYKTLDIEGGWDFNLPKRRFCLVILEKVFATIELTSFVQEKKRIWMCSQRGRRWRFLEKKLF